MKTIICITRFGSLSIVSAIILLGISLSVQAQMSGTYTITGTSDFAGREFESFNEAVDSLASQTVSAAVVINAQSGTYNEYFTIPYIDGASETNTITFQSETGDSNDVVIQHGDYSASLNHIVSFDNASHIILQNMTFRSTLSPDSYRCRIIYFGENSNNIIIRNNLFYSKEQ